MGCCGNVGGVPKHKAAKAAYVVPSTTPQVQEIIQPETPLVKPPKIRIFSHERIGAFYGNPIKKP